MAEIREAKRWSRNAFFELADDSTILDRNWGREFLRGLIPEQIYWFTETDVSVADDLELCNLLAEAGCRQLLIGFENPRAGEGTRKRAALAVQGNLRR